MRGLADWARLASAGPDAGEAITPVDVEDIEAFADAYSVHSSAPEPDHLLAWGCGISRDGGATHIWLLGRVVMRNPSGDLRIATAAFPVAVAANPEITPDDARSELGWYLAHRIGHYLSPGELTDVVEFNERDMTLTGPAEPTLVHGSGSTPSVIKATEPGTRPALLARDD